MFVSHPSIQHNCHLYFGKQLSGQPTTTPATAKLCIIYSFSIYLISCRHILSVFPRRFSLHLLLLPRRNSFGNLSPVFTFFKTPLADCLNLPPFFPNSPHSKSQIKQIIFIQVSYSASPIVFSISSIARPSVGEIVFWSVNCFHRLGWFICKHYILWGWESQGGFWGFRC